MKKKVQRLACTGLFLVAPSALALPTQYVEIRTPKSNSLTLDVTIKGSGFPQQRTYNGQQYPLYQVRVLPMDARIADYLITLGFDTAYRCEAAGILQSGKLNDSVPGYTNQIWSFLAYSLSGCTEIR